MRRRWIVMAIALIAAPPLLWWALPHALCWWLPLPRELGGGAQLTALRTTPAAGGTSVAVLLPPTAVRTIAAQRGKAIPWGLLRSGQQGEGTIPIAGGGPATWRATLGTTRHGGIRAAVSGELADRLLAQASQRGVDLGWGALRWRADLAWARIAVRSVAGGHDVHLETGGTVWISHALLQVELPVTMAVVDARIRDGKVAAVTTAQLDCGRAAAPPGLDRTLAGLVRLGLQSALDRAGPLPALDADIEVEPGDRVSARP